jgi:hypothetical protein
VKSAGIKSYASARDKLSGGTGPSSTSRLKPPPPRRAPSGHGNDLNLSTTNSYETTDVDKIDWANLSHEDKQVFFTWLDEFFARYLNQTMPTNRVSVTADSPGNTTASSPRDSPSLPPRRFGSRTSQNTASDPPNEASAAPTTSRRNLPPVLSQHGPVCPPF